MTYIYETVIGTKKLVVEYCYSSLHNKIKVVEMTMMVSSIGSIG